MVDFLTASPRIESTSDVNARFSVGADALSQGLRHREAVDCLCLPA
jgi:hypothetical protein